METRDAHVRTMARVRVVGGSCRVGSGVRGVASDSRETKEELDAGCGEKWVKWNRGATFVCCSVRVVRVA